MALTYKAPAYVKPANGRGFWVIVDGKPLKQPNKDRPRVFKTKGAAEQYAQELTSARH